MAPKTLRNHKVWANLFDRKGTPLGKLAGFLDGEVDSSAYASIKSTGRVLVQDTGQIVDGEWSQYRVQPVYEVNGVATKLGLFIPSVTDDDWDDETRTWDVKLADKTSLLDRSALRTFHTIPAGTNVVEAVRALIEMSGEPAGALTPTDATTLGTITLEPTTPLLKAINDLLSSANFFSLWCDGDGQFQVTPSTSVTARPVAAEYVDGLDGTALYTPQFSRSQDIASIPNRVIATSSSDADTPALVSVAENRNPDSPFSFDRLGVWVDHTEENIETTGQPAFDEWTQRRLESLSSAVANIQIGAWFEDVRFNQAVRFRSKPAGIDGRFTISNTKVSLSETALMTLTLREVVEV